MNNKNENTLTDDIEVVGPGQMLADARKALNLTQKEVADKLNFKLSLVKDIENEIFDKSLPETFNRGYLRNFAKLVAVNENDVIASYEMLDIAEKQGAEMQSFSKLTKKQAENNRIMWVTYLIIALIIGSTLVWLFQAQQQVVIEPSINNTNNETLSASSNNNLDKISNEKEIIQQTVVINNNQEISAALETVTNSANENFVNTNLVIEQSFENQESTTVNQELLNASPTQEVINNIEAVSTSSETQANQITSVIFTFKGDCWVNIFDSTGERIAWGVKKADYVMKIKGIAPFSITLGKPERVLINYDGSDLDMSQFNRGNIAKFTLPLSN